MPTPLPENQLEGERAIIDTIVAYHDQIKPLLATRELMAPASQPSSITVNYNGAELKLTDAALINAIRAAIRQSVTADVRQLMADVKSLRQA